MYQNGPPQNSTEDAELLNIRERLLRLLPLIRWPDQAYGLVWPVEQYGSFLRSWYGRDGKAVQTPAHTLSTEPGTPETDRTSSLDSAAAGPCSRGTTPSNGPRGLNLKFARRSAPANADASSIAASPPPLPQPSASMAEVEADCVDSSIMFKEEPYPSHDNGTQAHTIEQELLHAPAAASLHAHSSNAHQSEDSEKSRSPPSPPANAPSPAFLPNGQLSPRPQSAAFLAVESPANLPYPPREPHPRSPTAQPLLLPSQAAMQDVEGDMDMPSSGPDANAGPAANDDACLGYNELPASPPAAAAEALQPAALDASHSLQPLEGRTCAAAEDVDPSNGGQASAASPVPNPASPSNMPHAAPTDAPHQSRAPLTSSPAAPTHNTPASQAEHAHAAASAAPPAMHAGSISDNMTAADDADMQQNACTPAGTNGDDLSLPPAACPLAPTHLSLPPSSPGLPSSSDAPANLECSSITAAAPQHAAAPTPMAAPASPTHADNAQEPATAVGAATATIACSMLLHQDEQSAAPIGLATQAMPGSAPAVSAEVSSEDGELHQQHQQQAATESDAVTAANAMDEAAPAEPSTAAGTTVDGDTAAAAGGAAHLHTATACGTSGTGLGFKLPRRINQQRVSLLLGTDGADSEGQDGPETSGGADVNKQQAGKSNRQARSQTVSGGSPSAAGASGDGAAAAGVGAAPVAGALRNPVLARIHNGTEHLANMRSLESGELPADALPSSSAPDEAPARHSRLERSGRSHLTGRSRERGASASRSTSRSRSQSNSEQHGRLQRRHSGALYEHRQRYTDRPWLQRSQRSNQQRGRDRSRGRSRDCSRERGRDRSQERGRDLTRSYDSKRYGHYRDSGSGKGHGRGRSRGRSYSRGRSHSRSRSRGRSRTRERSLSGELNPFQKRYYSERRRPRDCDTEQQKADKAGSRDDPQQDDSSAAAAAAAAAGRSLDFNETGAGLKRGASGEVAGDDAKRVVRGKPKKVDMESESGSDMELDDCVLPSGTPAATPSATPAATPSAASAHINAALAATPSGLLPGMPVPPPQPPPGPPPPLALPHLQVLPPTVLPPMYAMPLQGIMSAMPAPLHVVLPMQPPSPAGIFLSPSGVPLPRPPPGPPPASARPPPATPPPGQPKHSPAPSKEAAGASQPSPQCTPTRHVSATAERPTVSSNGKPDRRTQGRGSANSAPAPSKGEQSARGAEREQGRSGSQRPSARGSDQGLDRDRGATRNRPTQTKALQNDRHARNWPSATSNDHVSGTASSKRDARDTRDTRDTHQRDRGRDRQRPAAALPVGSKAAAAAAVAAAADASCPSRRCSRSPDADPLRPQDPNTKREGPSAPPEVRAEADPLSFIATCMLQFSASFCGESPRIFHKSTATQLQDEGRKFKRSGDKLREAAGNWSPLALTMYLYGALKFMEAAYSFERWPDSTTGAKSCMELLNAVCTQGGMVHQVFTQSEALIKLQRSLAAADASGSGSQEGAGGADGAPTGGSCKAEDTILTLTALRVLALKLAAICRTKWLVMNTDSLHKAIASLEPGAAGASSIPGSSAAAAKQHLPAPAAAAGLGADLKQPSPAAGDSASSTLDAAAGLSCETWMSSLQQISSCMEHHAKAADLWRLASVDAQKLAQAASRQCDECDPGNPLVQKLVAQLQAMGYEAGVWDLLGTITIARRALDTIGLMPGSKP